MEPSSGQVQIIGAVKIRDGLFIGDQFAAQDLEFLMNNKVTHIVNCAGREVPNIWESIGVKYLTFLWLEADTQILFDKGNENVRMISSFISAAGEAGESVLVHSVRGQSRSCCALVAFLMQKYKWSLFKTLEYLNSRRQDLEIRTNFFHQLEALEAQLEGDRTIDWETENKVRFEEIVTENEEKVIRNTFLNSRGEIEKLVPGPVKIRSKLLAKPPLIKWADQIQVEEAEGKTVFDVIVENPEAWKRPLEQFKKIKEAKKVLSCLKEDGAKKKQREDSEIEDKTTLASKKNSVSISSEANSEIIREKEIKVDAQKITSEGKQMVSHPPNSSAHYLRPPTPPPNSGKYLKPKKEEKNQKSTSKVLESFSRTLNEFLGSKREMEVKKGRVKNHPLLKVKKQTASAKELIENGDHILESYLEAKRAGKLGSLSANGLIQSKVLALKKSTEKLKAKMGRHSMKSDSCSLLSKDSKNFQKYSQGKGKVAMNNQFRKNESFTAAQEEVPRHPSLIGVNRRTKSNDFTRINNSASCHIDTIGELSISKLDQTNKSNQFPLDTSPSDEPICSQISMQSKTPDANNLAAYSRGILPSKRILTDPSKTPKETMSKPLNETDDKLSNKKQEPVKEIIKEPLLSKSTLMYKTSQLKEEINRVSSIGQTQGKFKKELLGRPRSSNPNIAREVRLIRGKEDSFKSALQSHSFSHKNSLKHGEKTLTPSVLHSFHRFPNCSFHALQTPSKNSQAPIYSSVLKSNMRQNERPSSMRPVTNSNENSASKGLDVFRQKMTGSKMKKKEQPRLVNNYFLGDLQQNERNAKKTSESLQEKLKKLK